MDAAKGLGLGVIRTLSTSNEDLTSSTLPPQQCNAKCRFTGTFDRLPGQFCRLLDRLTDHLATHCAVGSWGRLAQRWEGSLMLLTRDAGCDMGTAQLLKTWTRFIGYIRCGAFGPGPPKSPKT